MQDVFTNDFSKEIWKEVYRTEGEERIEDSWRRVAKAIAAEEEDERAYWEEQFYDLLNDFKACPGGRILSNAGNKWTGTTLMNCYVGPRPKYDMDSLDGILEVLRMQAQTLKSEGGWGMNFSFIRPRGSFIHGIGVESPGAVKYMELFNKSSDIITAGSGKATRGKKKIRKGAQMGCLHCWHPDAEEFITAKLQNNRLDKFNISVVCSNKFMKAVENNEEWNLIFPATTHEKYKTEWNGNIEQWISNGYPIEVYKTVKARDLWDLIMTTNYKRNDPGVLFLDRANETHCCNYLGDDVNISSTNPCVAAGTLIATPNGYKKVEDIKVGDEVNTVCGFEKVDTIESHKNYPTFKVKFSDGGEQIVTAAHRYKTVKFLKQNKKEYPFKRLDELQVGDSVCVQGLDYEWTFNHEEYTKGLQIGILLGDGSYSRPEFVKIASSVDDVEYNNNVKKLFGEEKFIKDDPHNDGSKSVSLCFKKYSMKDYISELGLEPAFCENKYIDITKLTNHSVMLGVLDGLLATDGNINLGSTRPQVRWSTSSPRLIQLIRNILLYFNIHGHIHTRKAGYSGGCLNGRQIIAKHDHFSLSISSESIKKFADITRINLIHKEKYEKLLKAVDLLRNGSNRWHAKILSIEPYENCDVYDLYCSGTDTWITSGYVQRGCGEQCMPNGASCDLGSLNLVQFVDVDNRCFDLERIKKYSKILVRFLDNVNTVTNVPLQEYRDTIDALRRIGCGIMGWGSALYLLGVRFGSKEAEHIKVELMKTFTHSIVEESISLAEEKGMFNRCDPVKHSQHMFWRQIELPQHLIDKMSKVGIRNSSLFSMQPTGNTGVLCNIISGGIEPIFAKEYIRTVIVHSIPSHIQSVTPDFHKGEFFETDMFKFTKEGEETILRGVDENGVVWKIDKNRGLTKEVLCEDYAVNLLKKRGEWNPSADWAVTTNDLTVEDHLTDLYGWGKWIDASMSKTVNLPADYPFEDYKNIYLDAYKKGLKGITTYRANTMTSVLSEKTATPDISSSYDRRPKSLTGKLYRTVLNKEHYFIAIGFLNERPYEVFAGKTDLHFSNGTTGRIDKLSRGKYSFVIDGEVFINDLVEYCEPDEETMTRLLSMSMRHNVDLSFIVQQLEKTKGNLFSFSKIIARILKRFLKDGTIVKGESCTECKSSELIRQSGCITCKHCSWSKCS